jgi:hypothetical protein
METRWRNPDHQSRSAQRRPSVALLRRRTRADHEWFVMFTAMS